MNDARLRIFSNDIAASIDPRIYGSFLEHLGRAVYTGVYEPGHPEADAAGQRRDVLGMVRELHVPIVRYPGGNFVSGYRWEDGVGPRDRRPKRIDLAWQTVETNQFGTDEFVAWCKAAGTAPMMAVNLGTRGIQEAVDLLEYCNHPGGTALSDLRARHGFKEPHGVRVWCLGNEMDGPWQTGHKTAREYARLAAATARAMRGYDNSLELVACGSSARTMPTFPLWEQEVLEETYDAVDYISQHAYLAETRFKSDEDYLASPYEIDAQIREAVAACDYVKAKLRKKKTMMISFDEWNVWDNNAKCPRNYEPWSEAPPQLEQVYTMKDALVFAGMLLLLIRHAARVRIACLAQLVNVIAPIVTAPGGPAWKQTIFYPYLHASLHGRGNLLQAFLESPTYEHPEWGPVRLLDAVATRDGESITIFALNRSLAESFSLDAYLDGGKWRVAGHTVLRHDDLEAANSAAKPDNVAPQNTGDARADGDRLTATIAPASWNVIRLEPAQRGR